MKKKKTLTAKSILMFVLMAVLIIVFTCIGITVQYYLEEKESYKKQAFGYAKTASAYIDGDTVTRYLETGEKDAYYDSISDFLSAAQTGSGLKYYYVFVPLENSIVYIWDSDTDLGYEEAYMSEDSKRISNAAFSKQPVEEIVIANDDQYGYIASAFYPIYSSDGQPAALVGVDLPMERFTQTLRTFLLTTAILIAFIIIIFLSVFYLLIKNRIILPISKISKAASKMVTYLQEDTLFSIDIHTGDEIEELANSFNRMNEEVRDYMKKLASVTAEKERIGAELNVATQIQADMLPSIFPPFPDRQEFDIFATMTPAKEVGGDFYDFFLVDDDHLALVMADVSGKGVPAALFMVIAKTLIKNRAQMGDSPSEVLKNVNEQLCEGNEAELFVTVWLAILELSTGKGKAANAGHEHPTLRRANGRYELITYQHSPAVAALEGMRFREHDFELHPGDSLFVYTDGVAEATNSANELYGTDRMLDALNSEPNAAPKQLLANVKQSVDAFVGEAPQFDDLTMLGFTYFGNT